MIRWHVPRKVGWIDLLLVAGLAGLLFVVVDFAREWTGVYRPTIEIDLSPSALPLYTLFSLTRGFIAYGISLAFTLAYGYWAAKDHAAERVLVPLLDILQSIPVLGFMPALVVTLVAAFPSNNVGLELAAIVMIFTGQAWNMTFSFYHSLRSIPADVSEAATAFRFSGWQRFKWVELPFSTTGLVWNSMMSMAGGWFFLMISESFRLGDKDFRLPGIGAYMSVAVDRGNVLAMIEALVAMVAMIVVIDQIVWRPVVAWAQKFRVEEGGSATEVSSWFLSWLRRSRIIAGVERVMHRLTSRTTQRKVRASRENAAFATHRTATILSRLVLVVVVGLLAFGAWSLVRVLRDVSVGEWGGLAGSAGLTLSRVLVSTALGTLWTLPLGLAIGLSPRLSRILQPVVQVVASFPAPMLFPLIIAALAISHVPLGVGSVVLMLLGTQWYILFNVIAGAMAIPSDLREAASAYRIRGWHRFWSLYFPGVFPFLVTGWVTAAGGAWNASIVAEYVTFHGRVLRTDGLGARISSAAAQARIPLLVASVLVMSAVVVIFNRTVWRRCYELAESRFSLSR
ncbi:MAG: ABC transporter permease subunit [Planctomycetes bacterium]|nr:ABC transporter permease subunit [Planctomycetota bacterium]MBI3845558.1 ABC transporter permease subunit [Planctomycetota bacterium]